MAQEKMEQAGTVSGGDASVTLDLEQIDEQDNLWFLFEGINPTSGTGTFEVVVKAGPTELFVVDQAKVEYEFTVEGVTFEGDRIFFGKWSSGNDSKEQEIAWHYPEGKSVNVYYNPGNPEVCLLEPGKTGKSWSLILFGALFLLVGIFFGVVFDLR